MGVRRFKVIINGEKYELTPKEREILFVLRRSKKWIGPTKIGLACGQMYPNASAWCCPTLRKFLQLGIVERCDHSPFTGRYRLAEK